MEQYAEQTVEVSVNEVVQLYLLLEKLNDFFHQPLNYPDVQSLYAFLGNADNGVYREIATAYYGVIQTWLPPDALRELMER